MSGRGAGKPDEAPLIGANSPGGVATHSDSTGEIIVDDMVPRIVRRVAADWSRRYVGLLALALAVGLIATLTPSRPPGLTNGGQFAGWSRHESGEPVMGRAELAEPAPVAPVSLASPSVSPTTTPRHSTGTRVPQQEVPPPAHVAPPEMAPVADPMRSPLPDEPFPDFGTCLSGEPSGSTQLPIAQLLRVAGPILPLIGPVTPLVLGLLPLLGPFLPKILPVLPMIQPVLDKIGPSVESATPSIVEFENRLLAPLMPYIDQQLPKLLDAERELVAALEPQARRLAGLAESDCVGLTVATASEAATKLVAGELALRSSPTPLEGVAERVVTMVLRWSDPTELRARIREVAMLEHEDVMVRLVVDEARDGESTPGALRDWVAGTIRSLPLVSGWEISLPASGKASNVDAGSALLTSALTAALQNRPAGKLVGIGLPADLAGNSVLWDRLHDTLSDEARSRVNFVGVSVPRVSLDKEQRSMLLNSVRLGVAGFRADSVPLAISVVSSSANLGTVARTWAESTSDTAIWLLSLELAEEPSAELMREAMLALATLRRQVKP